ncbi:topless-related protein 4-like [Bidens hawaiensis]|uniref:topless-related protein 4-like n=1 Tax=Bidens hawaiensis TaxID=980011 RepID=UPI00404B3149
MIWFLQEFQDFHPTEPPVSLRAPHSQEMEDQIMSDVIVEPPVVPSGPKEITEPSQIRSLKLPDTLLPVEVLKIVHYGDGILVLAYNAVHKLWKWPKNAQTQTANASVDVAPQLCQHRSGILMTNDIKDVNLEDRLASLAVSDNHCYAVSTSGGEISLYNLVTFKVNYHDNIHSFFFSYNNIVIAGMLDGSIIVYNAKDSKIIKTFKGHEKCVTGLAFVLARNTLISTGTDGQLCLWDADSWKIRTSQFIEFPARITNRPHAPTRVHLNLAQTHFMVVHEKQITVFDGHNMGSCIKWAPRDTSGAITDAAYSCDGESIFVCVEDGSVGVLAANAVELKCWINCAAYMPSNCSVIRAQANTISAHPNKPNQFALGVSDGAVYVLEPPTNTGSDQMMVD